MLALLLVFALASVAWLILGGVMTSRTGQQNMALSGRVHDLWGAPQEQQAPVLSFAWSEVVETGNVLTDGKGHAVRDASGAPVMERETVTHQVAPPLDSTAIDVGLALDQRRKGLMWYSLYDVDFSGRWTYTHDEPQSGWLSFTFQFPENSGNYDGFALLLDGEDVSDEAVPSGGQVSIARAVQPGDTLHFAVRYRSRGMDSWTYRPTQGTGQISNFSLNMSTDFADIDFPSYTMSPTAKTQTGTSWSLVWTFDRLVTGDGMGMVMPSRVQPGPLAAEMSFSAPISLGLFMVWITVLGLLKGIEIHPMNHVFLAAAFFSFHLLFGYSVDHLPVEWAFVLSSVVSIALVVSYLRLVVGPRFALVEAGLAQLLYLVGFSLAHFWEGFTGLTVTVLGIITLFALMQLTGRIRWSEVMARGE